MEQNYRNYEYKTITAEKQEMNQIINRYASLGWELDSQNGYFTSALLTFKRERDIKSREQLNRLEVKIEDCAHFIKHLEESKTRNISISLTVLGMIFALVFGSGLCLCLLNPPAVSLAFVGGLVLGIIGLGFGAVIYPLYLKLAKKNTAKINPLIERKKDELADLCDEAHATALKT